MDPMGPLPGKVMAYGFTYSFFHRGMYREVIAVAQFIDCPNPSIRTYNKKGKDIYIKRRDKRKIISDLKENVHI